MEAYFLIIFIVVAAFIAFSAFIFIDNKLYVMVLTVSLMNFAVYFHDKIIKKYPSDPFDLFAHINLSILALGGFMIGLLFRRLYLKRRKQ